MRNENKNFKKKRGEGRARGKNRLRGGGGRRVAPMHSLYQKATNQSTEKQRLTDAQKLCGRDVRKCFFTKPPNFPKNGKSVQNTPLKTRRGGKTSARLHDCVIACNQILFIITKFPPPLCPSAAPAPVWWWLPCGLLSNVRPNLLPIRARALYNKV